MLCATNRVPVSYELTAATTADVVMVEELLDAAQLGDATARRLFGDLAYRSEPLKDILACRSVALATERANRRPVRRQQVEVCFATLKGAFGMAPWPRRSPDWRPGSRPRSALTPTASTSTGSWAGRRGALRSCGPEIFATLI